MRLNAHAVALLLPVVSALAAPAQAPHGPDDADSVGIFDGHSDVGAVPHPGSVTFDKDAGTYTVTGASENMWADKDAFHCVWKKTSVGE